MVNILSGAQVAKIIWAEHDALQQVEIDLMRAIADRLLTVKDERIAAKNHAREARVKGYTLSVGGHFNE